jgi:hypothetical protein
MEVGQGPNWGYSAKGKKCAVAVLKAYIYSPVCFVISPLLLSCMHEISRFMINYNIVKQIETPIWSLYTRIMTHN